MSDAPTTRSRIKFISVAVIFMGTAVILRLFYIQTFDREKYLEKYERQHYTTTSDIFERGSIYFTAKDGEAISTATVESGYKIVLNPTLVEDRSLVWKTVGKYSDFSTYDEFSAEYFADPKKYVEMTTKRSKEEVEDLIGETMPVGVRLESMKWRYYPGEVSAAQTVGFVAYNKDTLEGRYGVEKYYDNTLIRDSYGSSSNFFTELFSNNRKSNNVPKREGEVYLTIEPRVQSYLDNVVEDINNTWNSQATGAIILDPRTGEIMALSVYPNFDLNNFQDEEYPSIYANPFAERVYELGSVIKPIIMAIGIDTGKITPDTTYYDAGSIQVEDKLVYNFDKRGRGLVTMQDVLGESLNTGMADLSLKIGKKDFKRYIYSFGFNETTGIDIPNETRGLLKNLESPRNLEYATASFGQGIAVTPLEAVSAYSALINGGDLVVPHVGKKIVFENGESEDLAWPMRKEGVITQETSDTIKAMLTSNIDDYYKNKPQSLAGYGMGGKTGTAQIPNPVDGGYYDDRNMHSFFGFYPTTEPEFLVFMYTIYPKGVRYAAQTLLPPFMDIAEFTLSYYDVPPDR